MVKNASSSRGERAVVLMVALPVMSAESRSTSASGITLDPPNTIAKPGARQPPNDAVLVHQVLDDANAFATNVCTDADSVAEFAGTRITGTAS